VRAAAGKGKAARLPRLLGYARDAERARQSECGSSDDRAQDAAWAEGLAG
jgi:hypothetical protein